MLFVGKEVFINDIFFFLENSKKFERNLLVCHIQIKRRKIAIKILRFHLQRVIYWIIENCSLDKGFKTLSLLKFLGPLYQSLYQWLKALQDHFTKFGGSLDINFGY